MSTEKLVRTANQIASFFKSYPEEQAVAGIRDHLAAFWTPHMRDTITTYANQKGDKLEPLVIKALRTFHAAESPIEKQVAGPRELGPLESDAG
ncbi:formate dehydrogenase subunit delta [Microvirga rosea]|uniref:formate dehydrogenase subunit delta n=1 Tax=Microvirga rosea TaxID=2715425 RepID=UPI001D0B3410|nr:formate dehydrogenase subunit delta [Microvirga rosea]MCB8823062.1 formate dehydrogenase subunit delta [Microvirga rosea]